MNFYEKELRNMFGKSEMLQDAKFCDKMMIAKLDDDLRVKLMFTAEETTNRYDGVEIKIINRTEGEVDKQVFRFTDIVGKIKVSGCKENPFFNEHLGGWSVLISEKEREQITQAVLDYVGMFQEQGMVQAM